MRPRARAPPRQLARRGNPGTAQRGSWRRGQQLWRRMMRAARLPVCPCVTRCAACGPPPRCAAQLHDDCVPAALRALHPHQHHEPGARVRRGSAEEGAWHAPWGCGRWGQPRGWRTAAARMTQRMRGVAVGGAAPTILQRGGLWRAPQLLFVAKASSAKAFSSPHRATHPPEPQPPKPGPLCARTPHICCTNVRAGGCASASTRSATPTLQRCTSRCTGSCTPAPNSSTLW